MHLSYPVTYLTLLKCSVKFQIPLIVPNSLACPFFFQDYTITMYLNQYWKDERLSFSPEEDKALTLSGDFAEKIWVPDTFFANDKNRYELDQSLFILSRPITKIECLGFTLCFSTFQAKRKFVKIFFSSIYIVYLWICS